VHTCERSARDNNISGLGDAYEVVISVGQKVKFSVSTARGHMGGVEVYLHSFLTAALDGREIHI
jgi:hypothetical protein